MYQKEIPSELREDIKLVVQRNSDKIKFREEDLKYLMTIYYRYIGKLNDDSSLAKTVKKNLTCSNCVSKVQYYFKEKAREW